MTEQNWEGAVEVQSSWFKFVNVGDKIKGTLMRKTFQKSNVEGYQDQWVYELMLEDGTFMNVGVSAKKEGTIKRINNCKVGEIIGIIYEKEGEAAKGRKPAKMLKVVTFGMNPNYDEMMGGMTKDISADDVEM